MGTPDAPDGTDATPEWATIAETADLLDVTAKTVRRKIKAGELVAEKRRDDRINQERWYVDTTRLPRQPGTAAPIVPVEVLERISELHREITDAVARAERAEAKAEFQAERRRELQAERDRLRSQLEDAQRPWWRRKAPPPRSRDDENGA